jgi:L-ascorbate metabolism protein UlaG (beta-lactamase superfamily)
MVRAMLANGADPSAKDEHGTTPLINAGWAGNVEVGKLLLEAGAHPDSADQNGWTAMFPAVHGGHADFVRLLIEHGADVNQTTEQGETPMVRAVTSGDPDVLEALLAAGAATDVCESHFGWSVLHLAALRGYNDLAEQLLDAGAPMNAVDDAENTPLDLASRYGHKDVVDLLSSRGAVGDKGTSDGTLEAQGSVGEGEAVIWYLGHSGWAIKTRENLLVFDWFQRDRLPGGPGLCNGNILTAELAGENVTVFVSHEHGDHFDPGIFEWREDIPGITYVMGCHAEEAPPYEFVGPRDDRTINGMRVRTIESNDTGVGFLIEVDGVVIYHAGDHANRLRDFSGPYCGEIDYLADFGLRPDIAFMPISGCGFGDQEAVKMGVHYALEALEPRVFIPMHSGGGEYRYRDFISDCKDKFPDVQMEAAENKGDHYRYRDGRIS